MTGGSRRFRAVGATLLATVPLAFAPSAASADPLVLVDLPATGLQPVDEVVSSTQDGVSALLPPELPVQVAGSKPPPAPAPEPPPPPPPPGPAVDGDSASNGGGPAPASSGTGSPAQATPAQSAGSSSEGDSAGRQGSGGSGGGGDTPGPSEQRQQQQEQPRGTAEDAPRPAPATPEPADSKEPEPTVLERIVGVVPFEVKLAIGALAALLALATLAVRRTDQRLRGAEQRAVTDSLTGLPNRRHIDEVLERLLASSRRNKRPLSIILFDLDRFKAINDTFGHAVGDDVLRGTASAIRESLRAADHVGRFGGEEFIVVLPETNAPDAALVAEKLRLSLTEVEVEGLEGGFFTASLGVAAYPGDGIGADDLLSAADEALYRAKDLGRNRVEIAGSNTAQPLDRAEPVPAV